MVLGEVEPAQFRGALEKEGHCHIYPSCVGVGACTCSQLVIGPQDAGEGGGKYDIIPRYLGVRRFNNPRAVPAGEPLAEHPRCLGVGPACGAPTDLPNESVSPSAIAYSIFY